MSLRLRFTLLIVALVGALLIAVGLLHEAEKRERMTAVAAVRQESKRSWENLLALQGEAFAHFVGDYSWWDELLAFVTKRDPEWARTNLDEALPFHELSALWVTDAAGRMVYTVQSAPDHPVAPPPLGEELLLLVHQEKLRHWFAATGGQISEFRTAPIQPSHDHARASVPDGWLIVARRWDEAQLARLTSVMGGSAELLPPATPPVDEGENSIVLNRALNDFAGHPVALLRLTLSSPYLAVFADTDLTEATIFIGFGILLVLIVTVALQRWVQGPLGIIGASLRTRDATELAGLATRPDAVGDIAREVSASFERAAELENEIIQRKKITESLRENESALRAAIEERVHLGRNLHDSVIQTLYASGLGLAATRALLKNEPEQAERRLAQVHHTLNDTIRELRSFITGLEPEAMPTVAFQVAVQRVVDSLQPAEPRRVHLAIDEQLASQLTPHVRAETLHIIREVVSNAMRHSGAPSLAIILDRSPAGIRFTISDNGIGFDLARRRASGHGLTNISERATKLGAKLDILTSPGEGTEVTFILPPPPDFP